MLRDYVTERPLLDGGTNLLGRKSTVTADTELSYVFVCLEVYADRGLGMHR